VIDRYLEVYYPEVETIEYSSGEKILEQFWGSSTRGSPTVQKPKQFVVTAYGERRGSDSYISLEFIKKTSVT